MPEGEARERWAGLVEVAGDCKVPESDGIDSMRVYAAVRELVEEFGLHALTIGCYPHLMGRVCLAASLLADEGIPLACEGDVHGAVGQLLMSLLSGQPTHNTDWLDPLDDGTVVFTHCGSGSLRLADSPSRVTLGPVRLMDRGCCALFPAKPGPVTLIGFSVRPDGYQCALLEGEALEAEMVFPGNPLRVRFNTPVGRLMEWIHDRGVGHHWMIGYGNVAEEVRGWARIAGRGLRLVEP
jgi:L-fucose isomerase-like protein